MDENIFDTKDFQCDRCGHLLSSLSSASISMQEYTGRLEATNEFLKFRLKFQYNEFLRRQNQVSIISSITFNININIV